jgi:hypothetical protein
LLARGYPTTEEDQRWCQSGNSAVTCIGNPSLDFIRKPVSRKALAAAYAGVRIEEHEAMPTLRMGVRLFHMVSQHSYGAGGA